MLDMLNDRWRGELILYLISITIIVRNSEGHNYHSEESSDYLLCRSCGADIADSHYIQNRFSPEALIHGNQSLFRKHSVAVQLLENPLGIRFQVVVVKKANCIGVNEWHSEFSWYPGYAWKHCLCSHCGHHVGWIFEPLQSAFADRKIASDQGFYGLILDNVLSESSEETSACGEGHAGGVTLTEEQKQFLAACEVEFADRYTEADEEFIQYKDRVFTPPIVDPWYNKPRRNFDWSVRGRRHQNWGSRNDRGHNQGGEGGFYRQGDRFYGHRYRPF